MNRTHCALAFGFGSAATLALAAATAVVGAQAEQGQNGVSVCVGSDQVMRLAKGGQCAAGSQRMRLQIADAPELEKPKDDEKKPAEKKADPKPVSSKVQAPFEVVDYRGRTILRVDDTFGSGTSLGRGIGIYSVNGQIVSLVMADSQGNGVMRTLSANGRIAAAMAAGNGVAGLRVRENDILRLDIGRQDAGNYSLKVNGASGSTPLAALGFSASGEGLVYVSDGSQPLAAMGAVGGKGILEINAKSGTQVASLTQGQNGGQLQISSMSGTPMVEAGTLAEGVGVVRTGPADFPSLIGPFPISKMRGKK